MIDLTQCDESFTSLQFLSALCSVLGIFQLIVLVFKGQHYYFESISVILFWCFNTSEHNPCSINRQSLQVTSGAYHEVEEPDILLRI